ncbi:endonuclease/exonuclease/phosphatase family protein [Rheinheimera mesophila]|uniref:Endonuclease/exonuclease/phosphatase family protein n=2 Tax=Rheinheimera mesophila TaxID=1547515 RepID=A0A3P3QTT6_9GAMM|nr:endonuclease/exonuclease/phosphatase family protein [Rheinheimera mesophila]
MIDKLTILNIKDKLMQLKITSWNVEHSARLIGSDISELLEDRRQRVANTITDINPDILCMLEGPSSEIDITNFCRDVLNGKWQPVLLSGDGDASNKHKRYETSGSQWIWFLVKTEWIGKCRLQEPSVWQSFVGHKDWPVYYWGQKQEQRHSHYRHPQVLIFEYEQGKELEIIGQHMKSKINREQVWDDKEGKVLSGAYVDEALIARVKLATEARNIRAYVDARFNQTRSPAIIILGDANDGVGQDFFEQNYMFFDLISNLQGNVMQSDRFFNHALFDFPAELRWSAKYDDPITGKRAKDNPLLIDHILMSQALVNGAFPLQVNSGAGMVEHLAFDRANAGATVKRITSDHRPISVVLRSL